MLILSAVYIIINITFLDKPVTWRLGLYLSFTFMQLQLRWLFNNSTALVLHINIVLESEMKTFDTVYLQHIIAN